MKLRNSFFLGVVAPLLAVGLGACVGGAIANEARPRDPSPRVLSEAERARAVELTAAARADVYAGATPVERAKVTEEIITAVALYPTTDADDDRRLAAVTSFDYRTGRAARVVVDLSADRVVQSKALPGSAAPAAPEELARAKALLAADSEAYRKLFAAPPESYDLAAFVTVDEAGELSGHRILLLRPVYFRAAPAAPNALVDLTADRVLSYEDGEGGGADD